MLKLHFLLIYVFVGCFHGAILIERERERERERETTNISVRGFLDKTSQRDVITIVQIYLPSLQTPLFVLLNLR